VSPRLLVMVGSVEPVGAGPPDAPVDGSNAGTMGMDHSLQTR
jgi:hypothetical protein